MYKIKPFYCNGCYAECSVCCKCFLYNNIQSEYDSKKAIDYCAFICPHGHTCKKALYHTDTDSDEKSEMFSKLSCSSCNKFLCHKHAKTLYNITKTGEYLCFMCRVVRAERIKQYIEKRKYCAYYACNDEKENDCGEECVKCRRWFCNSHKLGLQEKGYKLLCDSCICGDYSDYYDDE